jgi:hypothetical protein
MAGKKLVVLIFAAGLVLALAGCSSDDPATPADTAPPAVPNNVFADYDIGGYIDVSWDDNVVDSDYAGVLITRTSNKGTPVMITPSVVSGNSYRDYAPGIGEIDYAIVAVDQVGNQSAAALATVTVRAERTPAIIRQ